MFSVIIETNLQLFSFLEMVIYPFVGLGMSRYIINISENEYAGLKAEREMRFLLVHTFCRMQSEKETEWNMKVMRERERESIA